MNTKNLITVYDAVELSGKSRQWLYQLMRDGRLKFTNFYGRRLLDRRAVLACKKKF